MQLRSLKLREDIDLPSVDLLDSFGLPDGENCLEVWRKSIGLLGKNLGSDDPSKIQVSESNLENAIESLRSAVDIVIVEGDDELKISCAGGASDALSKIHEAITDEVLQRKFVALVSLHFHSDVLSSEFTSHVRQFISPGMRPRFDTGAFLSDPDQQRESLRDIGMFSSSNGSSSLPPESRIPKTTILGETRGGSAATKDPNPSNDDINDQEAANENNQPDSTTEAEPDETVNPPVTSAPGDNSGIREIDSSIQPETTPDSHEPTADVEEEIKGSDRPSDDIVLPQTIYDSYRRTDGERNRPTLPPSAPVSVNGVKRWVGLAVASLALTGAVGAIYSSSNSNDSDDTTEHPTISHTSAPITTLDAQTPPVTPQQDEAETVEAVNAFAGPHKITTSTDEFVKYGKRLKGMSVYINDLRNVARDMKVDLSGNENQVQREMKMFRAFLEHGIKVGETNFLKNTSFPLYLDKLDQLEAIYKTDIESGVITDSSVVFADKTVGSLDEAHRLFKATRSYQSIAKPKGVKGYAVDRFNNPALSKLISNHPDMDSFIGVTQDGLKRLELEPCADSGINDIRACAYAALKAVATEKRKQPGNEEDGSLAVIQGYEKWISANGNSSPLDRVFRPVIQVKDDGTIVALPGDNSSNSKQLDDNKSDNVPATLPKQHPTDSSLAPAEKPSDPVIPSGAHTRLHHGLTPQEWEEIDNGWVLPGEKHEYAQKKTAIGKVESVKVDPWAPTAQVLEMASSLSKPKKSSNPFELSDHKKSKIEEELASIKRAREERLEKSWFDEGDKMTAQNLQQEEENKAFREQCPEWFQNEDQAEPQQSPAKQETPGLLARAKGFVKSLFGGKYSDQKEQRVAKSEPPKKKGFFRSLFG